MRVLTICRHFLPNLGKNFRPKTHFIHNQNFSEIREIKNFGHKSKFWSKIKIILRTFLEKSDNKPHFWLKLTKIGILVKNHNFSRKNDARKKLFF